MSPFTSTRLLGQTDYSSQMQGNHLISVKVQIAMWIKVGVSRYHYQGCYICTKWKSKQIFEEADHGNDDDQWWL